MTIEAVDWGDLPRAPAVYAMYGGETPRHWVAYVGLAGNLRGRVIQHFVNRDSSVATGTSAVGVNVDYVRLLEWWESPSFTDDDARHAAELVAFDVLDPALRSRGNARAAARVLYEDVEFRRRMAELFRGPPSGRFALPTISDLSRRVVELERRVAPLEEARGTSRDSRP